MSGAYFAGFLVVCGIAVGGVDYYTQSKRAGTPLSATQYVDTIHSRRSDSQIEREFEVAERDRQERWTSGAKAYLPPAPEAWSRHSLTDAQSSAVSTVLTKFAPVPLVSSISNPQELAKLANMGKDGLIRKLDETSAVYTNGEETIWFDISLKPETPRNTLAGLALGRQDYFLNGMAVTRGFAVIDGVAFLEVTEDMSGQSEKDGYRKITGRIGFDEEVVLRLHADASDATIRELLGVVDYAGLNTFLQVPASVVGQDIQIPMDQQQDMAEKMDDLYGEVKKMQDKVTQEKIENLDMGSVMVNTLSASGFNTEGFTDITGGKVFENQDVMQLGYSRALHMLLMSDQREAKAEPKSGGGFLKGWFGKRSSTEPSQVVKTQSAAPAEVRVRKGVGDSASCTNKGGIKRCSIGGN